jgi:glutamate dehydrogenase
LRFAAGQSATGDHWDRLATRRIIEDFMEEQAALAAAAMRFAGACPPAPDAAWAQDQVQGFLARHAVEADRTRRAIADLSASGGWTYAKLAIANAQLREFALGAGL